MYVLSIFVIIIMASYILQMTKERFSYNSYGKAGSHGYDWERSSGWSINWWSNWFLKPWYDRKSFPDSVC